MADTLQAGMAQYHVTSAPNSIMALGLGSCVGVAAYDPQRKIGGMVHIMLPDSTMARNVDKPAKFADTGIPLLIDTIVKTGVSKRNLIVKISGGSNMFASFSKSKDLSKSVGARNVKAVKECLSAVGVKIASEDTGGQVGRTMVLNLETMRVTVRKIGKDEVEL